MSGGNRTSLVISFLVLLSALEDFFFLPSSLEDEDEVEADELGGFFVLGC